MVCPFHWSGVFSLYRLQNATARLISVCRRSEHVSLLFFYFLLFLCQMTDDCFKILPFVVIQRVARVFSDSWATCSIYTGRLPSCIFNNSEFDFLIEILTADVFIASACVNLPNFVPIGPTVDEIMAIIWLFKMAAVGHLGFVVCVFGPPTKSIWLDTCFTYINLISYTHNLYHILCFSVASVAER